MASTILTTCTTIGAVVSILWPVFLRDMIVVEGGYGREIQPISEFPYQCRRIPDFEACEDMWLSEKTRQLYLACSTSKGRQAWMPNIGLRNATGRSHDDRIIAMSIDKPEGVGFQHHVLTTPGALGPNSDGKMSLVGLTGIDRADHVELYLVNNRPSVDTVTGVLLDQDVVGANSTIEHVKVDATTGSLELIRTFNDPQISTPNNIAARGDGTFYFTNDHGPHKVGWRHEWNPFMKVGDVTYCGKDGCRLVESGIGFANGLSFGPDGFLYVPSSRSGDVRKYRTYENGTLEANGTVPISYPLDNLSLDADGNLWVPGIPDIKRMIGGFADPYGSFPPATVFRIKKVDDDTHQVDKVLEDADGEVLPAATAVVHDVKTGRLFLSGVFSPFITVCEPRELPASGEQKKHDEL